MPYTGTSASFPLDAAIGAALVADAAVLAATAGDHVYSMLAPAGAPFDYVVLSTSSERRLEGTLDPLVGSDLTVMLDLWCKGADARAVKLLYGEVHRVLHGRGLAMPTPYDTGFRFLVGTLELVLVTADPSGDAMHGVARYTASVQRLLP